MIQNSFVHLPGIGPETEARFWAAGVHTWDDLERRLPEMMGPKRASLLSQALDEARAAHDSHEFAYFQSRLKGSEMWRLLPAFLNSSHLKNDIAYLDIETTGLGFPPQCQSTTIAVLFQGELHLEHDPLRKRQLVRRLENEARLLVTFNGGTFDLPFLRREFSVELRHPHLDLRYWMARLGRRGGLKAIQKSFDPDEVPQRDSMDIDGYDAVRLWRLHKRGVPGALETLFAYNAEDTLVLEHLIYCGLNLEARDLRHQSLKLGEYTAPPRRLIPFEVNELVYRMLRGG